MCGHLGDPVFESKAKDILGASDSEPYNTERARFTDYVDRVTKAIPVLNEIANTPTTGVVSNKVSDYREEGYVCLTATGLVVLGRIGHELFKTQHSDWIEVVNRLSQIDWRRSGPLWEGNIVRDNKIITQRAAVKLAVERVRVALGLKPDPKLELIGLLNEIELTPVIEADAAAISVMA